MSFKPTTQDLWREIEESEKVRDEHLTAVNMTIKEYVGRWYRGGGQSPSSVEADDYSPEPFTYSFISNIMPGLFYSNPHFQVKARRVIGHQLVRQAMQSGLRGWVEDINYEKECERAILDMLFFQGVLLHYIEDDTRWANGAVRPQIKRLPFQNVFGDPLATCVGDAEYIGHRYYADLDELMADPAADPAAVEKLKASYSSEDQKAEPFKKPDRQALKRNQVCLHSVWMRRTNTIRVLAKGSTVVEVYPEREWYGPACGPYEIFQAYPVPGQFYPLSPLIAVRDQVIDMNVHARSASRSAAGRKTIFIVDGSISNLPENIKDAEDREVIPVPGFNSSQCQQIDLGGVSREQYEYLGFLRQRLDRHSGLTETARGNASASDTATEATIANDALSNRTEWLKKRVRQGVTASFKKAGWFLFHTTGIIIPVVIRDPMTGMEQEGLFFGGPIPGQDTGKWDDYAIEIEPLSIQRVGEQATQRRATDTANFIMTVAPMIPQLPYLRWQEILRMFGEAMNQPNIEDFIHWELLGMMSSPLMQPTSGLMPGQQTPPRYFSMPGEGFKSKLPQEMNSNASVAVDDRRSEYGRQFGPMGGGLQGPPGSAGSGLMVPGKRAF